MKVNAEGKLRCRSLEPSFVIRGFSNWKDTTMLFCKHEESGCHKDAVQVINTISKDTPENVLRVSIFKIFLGGQTP